LCNELGATEGRETRVRVCLTHTHTGLTDNPEIHGRLVVGAEQ
jgi:hypothetical protein